MVIEIAYHQSKPGLTRGGRLCRNRRVSRRLSDMQFLSDELAEIEAVARQRRSIESRISAISD